MQKFTNLLKQHGLLIFLLLISIPSFYRMLRPGIFSMADFHFFRLYEFDKCFRTLQLPCRWAPDAGLGFGEPLFNFYGQAVYFLGELFHLLGASIIDTLKILFIISLVGSAVSMFFLAKKIWKDNYSALISAVLYLFAPYRAVDVWVRGALPEAFSFVLFPLIILSIEANSLSWFTILVTLLITTHNLSFVMFLPFLIVWIIYKKFWKSLQGFLLAALLSAYYVLPVLFESQFVDIGSTIVGYFDYRAHFVTIYQIFVSRFWGYGGSTWGVEDGLSLSVGLAQWILPLVVFLVFVFKKNGHIDKKFLIPGLLGLFYLFLTHNKSTFIWNSLPFMPYIQFPWRFLGMATFSLALAAGVFASIFSKRKMAISLLIIGVTIALNTSFFKEDIWYDVGDSYFTSGSEWDRQRSASITDYWPKFGHEIPDKPGDGKYINYFPGWNHSPDENGLIPAKGAIFSDTPVRRVGNIISLTTLIGIVLVNLTKGRTTKK